MSLKSLPDLYRYRITELPAQKVIAGVSLVTVICVGLFAANYSSSMDSAIALSKIFFVLQAVAWCVWAPTQSSSAISSERADRTWDFQRLTPLSSGQTALGRLIGAPLFSYLIGLLILPWGLIAALLAGGAFLGTWALCQLALLSAVLVCNSLGLLISSNPTLKSGRANLAAGSIVGVILVSLLTAMINVRVEEVKLVTFYTLDLNPGWFLTLTAFAFGIWIFLGAKWQIGRDYLEQRKAWRLPAFLLFTGFYFNGFIEAENFARIVMSGLAVFIFGAAMSQLSGETFSLKAWYKRVRNKLPNAVQAIPIWLSGWMSLVTITIAYSVYHRNLILFPLVFFSLRDLVLLEASRYFGFKQSRNFALALVLCLYVVPLFFVPFYATMLALAAPISLVVPDLFSSTFSYPVLKAFSPTLLFSLSVASGLLQAVIAAGLLATLQKKRSASVGE